MNSGLFTCINLIKKQVIANFKFIAVPNADRNSTKFMTTCFLPEPILMTIFVSLVSQKIQPLFNQDSYQYLNKGKINTQAKIIYSSFSFYCSY